MVSGLGVGEVHQHNVLGHVHGKSESVIKEKIMYLHVYLSLFEREKKHFLLERLIDEKSNFPSKTVRFVYLMVIGTYLSPKDICDFAGSATLICGQGSLLFQSLNQYLPTLPVPVPSNYKNVLFTIRNLIFIKLVFVKNLFSRLKAGLRIRIRKIFTGSGS